MRSPTQVRAPLSVFLNRRNAIATQPDAPMNQALQPPSISADKYGEFTAPSSASGAALSGPSGQAIEQNPNLGMRDYLDRQYRNAHTPPPAVASQYGAPEQALTATPAVYNPNGPQQPTLQNASLVPRYPEGYDQTTGRYIGSPPPVASQPASQPPVGTPQQSAPQVSPSYYASLRQSESSGNPNAQSPTSSAYGPYQFTRQTWNDEIVRRHPELGLTEQDRLNPAAQEKAIPVFTQDRQAALARAGIAPSETNTKIAHFLGDTGAAQFLGALKANPQTPADTVVSQAALAANHNVFYNEDGTPKTVGQVYASQNARPQPGAGQQQSPLNDPSLQPPKPGDSYTDRILNSLGMGSVSKKSDLGDKLFNMGVGMMSAGPSIGVKGPAGAAISALNAAGKGGMYMNQQAQEQQKLDMQKQLHDAQIAHQQFEMKKPFQIGSSVVYMRDPVTQMLTAHNVTNYGTIGPDGRVVPLTQDENMRFNGISGAKGPGVSAPVATEPSKSVSLSDGTEAPLPKEFAGKVDTSNPIDVQALRIISGQEAMPTSVRSDPRYLAIKNRVHELDPTYTANRAKYYEQYGGPNGKMQGSFNAFGTALTHAKILDDLNHGKDVTDLKVNPLNWVEHGVERAFGAPSLESYEKTARAFGNEMERTLVQTGQGTGRERQEAADSVSSNKPLQGRLSGNAANVEILLGKMKKLDDAYLKNMGVGAKLNKPQFLTNEDKETIRDVFDHEPNSKIKQERYDRLSKDPRTADLVSPPKNVNKTQAANDALLAPQPGLLASAAENRPPVPGARKAPDGNWYTPDPTRPGKYLRVD